ncbi:MAG: S8 family serine peptidase [Bdellovibrionales bacterium]|nr:S8 family serine peptidase [Bdellovibrionales bacterium]
MFSKKFVIISLTILFLGGVTFYLFSQKPLLNERSNSSKNKKFRLTKGKAQFIKKEENLSQIQKRLEDYFNKQWYLKDIEITEAFKKIDSEVKNQRKIVVAVIDTGLNTKHPCFKGQIWTNKKEIPNNNKDDDQNGFIDDIHGWNFVDNNNDIQDSHGHGTHVSGIIAANGSKPCKMTGISPQVEIMVLKYFDPSSLTKNNLINTVKAIEYAVEQNVDIINYSGGGPGKSDDEKVAIAKAADKGIIFVTALGNEGEKIKKEKINSDKNQYYPASYKLSNIIPVESHNKGKDRLNSSNYREETRFSAPGEELYSTLPPKTYALKAQESINLIARGVANVAKGDLKGGVSLIKRGIISVPRVIRSPASIDNYGNMTGTSQATAVTSGVVALTKIARYKWFEQYELEKSTDSTKKSHPYNWPMEKVIQLVKNSRTLSAHKAVTMRPSKVNHQDEVISNTHDESSKIYIRKSKEEKKDKKDTIFENLKNLENNLKKNKN